MASKKPDSNKPDESLRCNERLPLTADEPSWRRIREQLTRGMSRGMAAGAGYWQRGKGFVLGAKSPEVVDVVSCNPALDLGSYSNWQTWSSFGYLSCSDCKTAGFNRVEELVDSKEREDEVGIKCIRCDKIITYVSRMPNPSCSQCGWEMEMADGAGSELCRACVRKNETYGPPDSNGAWWDI